jgi:glycerol-3-phosphate acyltransferase PlsY
MHWSLALILSYLCGSVPTAYLAGRALKGIDLRTVGSGNLGATNVYRNLGPVPALIVLVLDALKGAVPVALLPSQLSGVYFFELREMLWWGLACGAAAIVGHAKPVFLLGKGGGKGVATAAGVFGALAPAALGIAALIFMAVVFGSGFVSLASLAAALALPVAVGVTLGADSPVFPASIAIAAFVVWAHRANIGRLRAGTEPRTFRRPAQEESE